MATDDPTYVETKPDLSRRRFLKISVLTSACVGLTFGGTQNIAGRDSSRIIMLNGWVLQESDLDQ